MRSICALLTHSVLRDQEGLRYHPVVPHAQRIADKDDVIPLSRPITTESGEVLTEIAVPKGTRIVASIAAYNRSAVQLI